MTVVLALSSFAATRAGTARVDAATQAPTTTSTWRGQASSLTADVPSRSAVVIDFEKLKRGEEVTQQYASDGVTFNAPIVDDYSGRPLQPFAHSKRMAVHAGPPGCEEIYYGTAMPSEVATSASSSSRLSGAGDRARSAGTGQTQCVPVAMTFTSAARRVALWVGYDRCLDRTATVRLRAFDDDGALVAEDTATIGTNVEARQYGSAVNTRLEAAAAGGIRRANVGVDNPSLVRPCHPRDGPLVVDDVEFEAPAATVVPDTVDFGQVAVGGTGMSRQVTVTSTGTTDLHVVGSATVRGGNASDFVVTKDGCRRAVLAPKASCTVEVAFRPGAAGARLTTLTIPTDAPGDAGRSVLKGTGTGGAPAGGATVSPPSLDFGTARVGTPGPVRLATVAAPAGGQRVEVHEVAIDPPTGDFALTTTACSGVALHPGTSCAVEVQFRPGATGSRSAVLTVSAGTARTTHRVALRGTGTTSDVPAVTLTPNPVDFGVVQLGPDGARRSLTVRNAGTAPLGVRRSALSGADAADFTVGDRCSGTTVAPGGSCTVEVHFRPRAASKRRAVLAVTTNAADSPHAVGLVGSGVAVRGEVLTGPPSLAVRPTSGPPGSKVTVTGTGFQGMTALSWHSPGPGTALVSLLPDGATGISVTVTIPKDAAPGAHHVKACDSAGRCASDGFDVALSADPAASSFPRLALLVLALGLMGGAAFVPVRLSRRRRSAGPAPPHGGGDATPRSGGGGGRDRPVYTGFTPEGDYHTALDPSEPLEPARSYHFWVELGAAPSPSAGTAGLTVALFDFEGEIEIDRAADRGELEVRADGAVVVRQGGLHTRERPGDDLLARRVFFPVRTPAREGRHRLRCSLYHDQVLVQSWLVTAMVRRRRADSVASAGGADPQSRQRDYVLSRTLDAAHLSRLSPHRLSLMLNDNAEGTHGFRLLGEGGFKADAIFDVEELREHGSQTRRALRRVACGAEDDNGGQGAYRYDGPLDHDRLAQDLASLARRGYRVYSAIVHRLAAGAPGEARSPAERLAALLQHPGRIQLCNKVSARQALPAALIYDRDLDDALPDLALCPAFIEALHDAAPLERSACFTGACPTLGEPDVVCPSGFWGFRHVIGVPQSIGDDEGATEAPLEVRGGELVVDVAVSTDPAFVCRLGHEEVVRSLHPRIDWRYGDTRAEVLQVLRSTQPHLVYFYCHGGMDEGANVPFLEVGAPGETPITGSNLLAYKVVWDRSRPLVVINGCHTTALGPQTPLELVTAFVQHAQAAGVIGTEITVFEPLACAFAEELLRRLVVEGQAVGDAVRAARLALLKQGNPLGLAYVPFVSDDLRITTQPSSPRVVAGRVPT